MADASIPDDQRPVLNVVGDRVALGPLSRDQLPLYHRWWNDLEVIALARASVLRPKTADEVTSWYEGVIKDSRSVWFVIYSANSDSTNSDSTNSPLRSIGFTALFEVDQAAGTATLGIFIAERDCWGKGYGTETCRLTLDYAFSALGLRNVMLVTDATNERAIRCYLKAGFREFGRRRQAHSLGGKITDVVYMDCLASEFESPVLRRLLP